jgi:twinkle protein
VVSVQSASSAVRDCSADFSFLSGFERVYLAFDNDAAGRAATAQVAKLFEHGKVFHVRFTNRKDANEYLQLGETGDLVNIWHNAKPYVPDNIIFSFDDFSKALSKPHKEGVPYPFPTLNKMTYGLRTGEVVLLKAPEKVGKTSLMHEFLRNILRRTDDNVAAIFLEEPKHRLLQSLAGLEIGRPVHLPSSNSTEGEILDAVKQLVRKDERLHIYDNFGATDPDVFLDLVRFLVAGRLCKYVLFDHISIGCSVGHQTDERRVIEYLANRLEMLVKELDFSLIMVSHVNDFGQTRGSHYLTKVADITIDASRNTQAQDEIERQTIQLSVPYNRFCASTGPAGAILFDPDTYRLTEREPANDDGRTTGLQHPPWETPIYGRAA